MRAKGSLGVLLCVVAALLLPTGAAAKPGYYVSPHERSAEASIQGSNGYRLKVFAFSGLVTVFASKRTEQVLYIPFNSRLRDDRMRAHLPGVGRVDLRFHERGRSREDPPPNCKGAGVLTRRGIFRGRLKVSGERGYTRVDVRAIHGKIVDEPRQVCRRGNGSPRASADTQEELIRAVAPRGQGNLELFAIHWGSALNLLPNTFSARLTRLRGQMVVANSVYGFSEDPESISVGRPPVSGSVIPPKPLTGTATFQRETAGVFTWVGDLAAEIPGVGPVRLAGPHFNAEACLGNDCKGSADPRDGTRSRRLIARLTAAAPTPSPWRWPGSPR